MYNNDFKVIGYFPDWKPSRADCIRFDIITHLIYGFSVPKKDGTIAPLLSPEIAQRLIQEAHENNVKVLLAVGGWFGYDELPLEPVLKEITDSEEKREFLVSNIMKLALELGVDGIDFDWVYPRFQDDSQTQYEKLMFRLSKELKKHNMILSTVVPGGVNTNGNVIYDAAAHSDAVIDCVDWIHIMAYDGDDGENHSTYEFALSCADYWKNKRNVSSQKLMLGVPFYGRPSWVPYNMILKDNPDAHQSDVSIYNKKQIHYNGIHTIYKKTKWAKDNLGGIMMWELSHDSTDKDKSLLCAVKRAVN